MCLALSRILIMPLNSLNTIVGANSPSAYKYIAIPQGIAIRAVADGEAVPCRNVRIT